MQKTMLQLFARLQTAFKRASASQWVAYIIVIGAIVMLIYVMVDRAYSPPRVTESYRGKTIKESESTNCSETLIKTSNGDPGCSNTSTDNCNKVTLDKKAVFDNNLTILQPENANKLISGMESFNFCNNPECSSTRSLQDVVNEYKYYHIPNQLHKVNINRKPIAKEFNVLLNNRCKINNYITQLKNNNDSLQNRIDDDEINIMKKLRDKKNSLQNSLPPEEMNEETN